MANAQGGLKVGNQSYQLKWNVYDVGCQDTAETQTALQRAILQDGVNIFVNDFGVASRVAADVCDKNRLLYAGVSWTDDVVSPKFQHYIRPIGGFFGRAMNYYIYDDYKQRGAKTYVGCTVDGDQGHYAAGLCAATAKLVGLETRPSIFFPGNTVDFSPIATKIRSLNVDVVDLVQSTGEQVVNIVAALKDAGWKGLIAPGPGLDTATLANLAQKVGNFVEGMEMLDFDPRQIPSTIQDPSMMSLINAYTKEYGEFKTDGAFWTGPWFVLQGAIKATNNVDADVLKQYLGKGSPPVKTLAGYVQLFARPDLKQNRAIDGAPGHGI
jgi:ABC-type branched-subunit amino acid transport system substrate-binding protein